MSSPDSMIIGRDQARRAHVQELEHHALELVLAHLAVRDAEAHLRHERSEHRRDRRDRLDRLWTKNACPPRSSSRMSASATDSSAYSHDLGVHGEAVARRASR
jgi:hypothetical protein